MTLMDDIKSALTNDSASLSNTLRKAKILATTMRLSEFREWVDYELGGYPKQSEVPAYRVLRTQSVGQFSGPFGSVILGGGGPCENLTLRVESPGLRRFGPTCAGPQGPSQAAEELIAVGRHCPFLR